MASTPVRVMMASHMASRPRCRSRTRAARRRAGRARRATAATPSPSRVPTRRRAGPTRGRRAQRSTTSCASTRVSAIGVGRPRSHAGSGVRRSGRRARRARTRVVDVAPVPVLAGLERPHDRVPRRRKCLVAWRFGELSQQPTWPHDWHTRRWTQRAADREAVLAAVGVRARRLRWRRGGSRTWPWHLQGGGSSGSTLDVTGARRRGDDGFDARVDAGLGEAHGVRRDGRGAADRQPGDRARRRADRRQPRSRAVR